MHGEPELSANDAAGAKAVAATIRVARMVRFNMAISLSLAAMVGAAHLV